MASKEELINAFRHAKGLFLAVTRIAQDEKAIKCHICQDFHTTKEPHIFPKGGNGDTGRN